MTEDRPKTETKPDKLPLLSVGAKLYVALVLSLGAGSLVYAFTWFETTNSARFGVYLACAIASSVLKVYLPGVTGTMSVNFLFVLLAVADCSAGEAVFIALFAILVQYVWQSRKRLRMVQLCFNLASISFAALLSWAVYHWPFFGHVGVDRAVVLALTACLYFVANTLPVAVVIALTERKRIVSVWQSCYFWSFPFYLVGAALVGALQFASNWFGWQRALLILPIVYTIYRSYRLYLDRLESEKRHAEDMAGLHLRTIEALALAIEAKDHTTNEHLHRVQIYAQELGKELGLPPIERDALQAAALLHDIGKLAVPEHIISKPGRLTPEEFEKMKIHPVVGAEILERVKFPYPVVPIVAAHHEKWDGTGYPKGLAGEAIPMGARILAAVDCLDALASDRQYRRALPLDDAMAMVRSQSGASFDPQVVEVLYRRYHDLEALARTSNVESMKLSTDIKIAPDAAPAAGYVGSDAAPATRSDHVPPVDFLSSIAAARSEVQMLFEVAQAVGSSLSLPETLSVVAHRMQALVPHDTFLVYLQRDNKLEAEYATGVGADVFGCLSIPVGEGLSGWVAENRKPICNGNPAVETGYLKDATKVTALRSTLAVPLEGIAGLIGVVAVYSRQADAFTKDHLRILLAASSKLGLSIENSLRFEQAETSAGTDFLTGLPNGRSLFMHLQKQMMLCRQEQKPLAVLVCDVDGFKQINDRHGHLEGDRFLRRLSAVLKEKCRGTDYVARMGGDEFVVVLTDADEITAARMKDRLRESSAELAGYEFGSNAYALSIGAAQLNDELTEPEELLAEADRRMYKAKRTHHAALLQPAATPKRVSASSRLRIVS